MLNRHLPHVKWVLPSAPEQPVTLNFGSKMPSWFDILGLTPDAAEATSGIQAAEKSVSAMIDAEVAAGTPAEVRPGSSI